MVQADARRTRWVRLGLLVSAVGCTPQQEPVGPTTGELGGVDCSTAQRRTDPDLMAWDPGSRMSLSRLRKQGVVAVRYEAEGCNVQLELLPNCIGKGQYTYEPYSFGDSKLIRTKQQLFTELPLGAARLAGKLESNRVLRTDYVLVGMVALPPSTVVMASDLRGPGCGEATHVISRVYLGGFGLASGDQRALSGQATIFGARVGAIHDGSAARVATEGNPEQCREAQRTGKELPLCAVPLRVGLTPIEGQGHSACPEGSSWDGKRCRKAGNGRTTQTSSKNTGSGYGDASPCLRGGNALYLNGDPSDYVHPRPELIQDATFELRAERDWVLVRVRQKDDQRSRRHWSVDLSTRNLGAALQRGKYPNATNFATMGPRMSIGGDGRGCNHVAGRFEVVELEWSGETLRRFTATFQQHCELRDAALRGCVHYESPP